MFLKSRIVEPRPIRIHGLCEFDQFVCLTSLKHFRFIYKKNWDVKRDVLAGGWNSPSFFVPAVTHGLFRAQTRLTALEISLTRSEFKYANCCGG